MNKSSSIPSTEFEIHFAVETGGFGRNFREKVYAMGFRDDPMVGDCATFSPDDPAGRVACAPTEKHITWDTFDRNEFVRKRTAFDDLLTAEEHECVGYAHCEVIKPEWDLDIEYKPFDTTIVWPLQPFNSDYRTQPKNWDIHISADRSLLDPKLEEILCHKNYMYYIDLNKSTGRTHRVFTVQGTNPVKDGLLLFNQIANFLFAAGGMAGSIKFEETCYWREVGGTGIVPPTITAFKSIK